MLIVSYLLYVGKYVSKQEGDCYSIIGREDTENNPNHISTYFKNTYFGN